MTDNYTLAFSCSTLGPKSFQKILIKFGTSEKGWNASEEEFAEIGIVLKTYKNFVEFKNGFDCDQYNVRLKKAGVEFVAFADKRYPKGLRKIENPPIGLFCNGNVKLLKSTFSIGVVGTRKITQYGQDVTEMLVKELVKNGAVIVSGLALGVDGLAHRVTTENKGLAIAVLACGVDCCLPSENYSLYSSILKSNGLVVSEYPLSAPPFKGTFLARNRIVAALSDGVLITEAAEGSGSLVTAAYALQYGKKVFAVPGQITSRMSDGSLQLLKQGAKLVSNAEDILQEFSSAGWRNNSQFSKNKQFANLNLTKEEKKIVFLIQNEGLTIDEISKLSKLPVSKIFIAISNLEIRGIIRNAGGKISAK